MARVWAWLLARLQERCRHDGPENVTADLLEGDAGDIAVRWCRVCGAVSRDSVVGASFIRRGEWRNPRPLWWVR